MPSPNTITISQLSRLIGTPDCPIIIDVRIDEDFDADPRMIPGAIRHPYNEMTTLLGIIGSAKAVVVCHKGLKLSQGAAAVLRNQGSKVEFVEGGHVAWSNEKLPLVPAGKIPKRNSVGQSIWVTRHRPKIDRIACPWLIKRFVDPLAQFLFVAPDQVLNVAERFDATAFDIEGVFWSHRGDNCTFDTMIMEFGLETEALLRLAKIVRGADTDHHELAPQSAGLLAASLGLSRMYRDDLQQLDAGMLLYDAFYRWSRDAVDEGHDWPVPAGKP